MEISEEQRKQAIINARRAKQGKNKSRNVFSTYKFIAFTLMCDVESCPFS